MKGKATSFDIAHYAGVSQSTVSRALRNSPLVNDETRRRVHDIAKKLNYKVDKNASNLRTQQSSTLALLLFEDPTSDESQINPFFLAMLGSITRACAKEGYDLLVSFQSASADWQADYEDSHRADGIILLGYGDYIDFQPKFNTLLEQNTKFVCWGASVDNRPDLTISCDNYGGGKLAAEHFLAHSRKDCAFIGDASDHSPEFFARFNGFKDALQQNGITLNDRKIANAISTEESGYHATRSLIANNITFNALFAASDLIAIGAIRALKEANINVPKDVAVIGFDNISIASYINPPLTTIEQNTTIAGQMLVENLLKLIRGEQVQSTLLPPRLIARGSS
ncbi:LacI family DNA-binding transcriptional regulator [Pseudoalteromonas sp. SCSIO 43095]|jgi:DNA-binding LacI/PurR family transcriptional regulator|uniref:LacI family DNA-binding transcriptional regulator n=1 Tax=Pseudoalteromonas TaxID=53246 RepID=UPI000849A90F|nr:MULTISPECIES: LacI family DNA-binding transcriptional regulator [Pseudoalteromonas]MBT2152308.1 LacI family DNA-binding transcriptional regulator [Pseudoalteromonas tetraodonis]MCK8131759.1 LacI family DNA-binding transcriptional regulator [Pseudoalteromonas sp. 2CM28B]MDX1361401.1 LacI family DNA-binding transcriptional regulator [Pseudoalteromonas tetraodonis]MDX1727205.1 LacI family DNA-binding transcriptional regulator [Pseudoalteromonas tetraodonis]ODS14282.1 LacI family transcriptiona